MGKKKALAGNPNDVLLGNRVLEKGSINTIQILCNAMKSGAELIFNGSSVGEGDDDLAKKISELCIILCKLMREMLQVSLFLRRT